MAEPDPTEDAPEAPEDEGFDAERAKEKIAKANREAEALRKRLKELEAKAAKLDELENAGKSELERLTAQTQEAERKAQEAEARALRLEVAANKGLTPAQAKRLVGSSVEELEADADELLATFAPADPGDPKPTPSGKPREQLKPGSGDPDEPVAETDVRKLGERMFAR